MKRILIILSVLLIGSGSASAQTFADDAGKWANEWKHAFSSEGVKEWKPEFTIRYYAGFVTNGPMVTGGVRVDEKRSFALFLSQGDTYIDHAPGDIYSISSGLNFRRYWHLGARKTFAIYSDIYAGASWVYKVNGKYHLNTETGEQWEIIDDNVGDVNFFGGWQPGIRVRCYRNLHIFLGPTIATDCLGFHLGIGF
jgi:hypothetical protein